MDTKSLSASLRAAVSGLHKELRRQNKIYQDFSMTEIETIGQLLRAPALLPSELASLTRVKTQSMSQILNKLEEQGLVKRTPSKEDKRKVYISVTAYGKKMVATLLNEREEWLRERIETTLTEKEKELLVKAAPVLHKLLDLR